VQTYPIQEWQRLTTLYSEMGDLEMRELTASIGDLTDVAQQVLREELKKRGFDTSNAALRPGESDRRQIHELDFVEEPEDANGLSDDAQEFTWKTFLCDCEDSQQARQLTEVLRRIGIESWIERPRFVGGLNGPRVLVAADQLELARLIAAQPIPQEIIDESNQETPEFELPRCPECSAEDPTLESVDAFNSWECESCGNKWTEAAPESPG
jgi:hypothetical protein